MNNKNEFPIVSNSLLTAWHWIMRHVVFRGAPRISSHLCRWLLPKNCTVKAARGYMMAINACDYFEACALCDCMNRHLTNFIDKYLQTGDIFIDGGGNIGQFSLLAALKVGSTGKVLVYEPNPVIVPRLEMSCSLNKLNWVSVHQKALGSKSGQVPFYVAENSQLSSLFEFSHRLGHYYEVKCKVVRLDEELSEQNFQTEQIALVKLDLEGGELEALKGMNNLLMMDDPPAFMIELNSTCRPDGIQAIEEIVELFHSLGYQGLQIEPQKVYWKNQPPHLRPLQVLTEQLVDAFFIRPGSTMYDRLLSNGLYSETLREFGLPGVSQSGGSR